MHTRSSARPLTVKFSPNWPYSKSSRPSWRCQYWYDPIWYTNTARCSPPCPARSPCPSPSIFSRPTSRGPSTGRFHTAVCTVWPCHATSCGMPTFTDSKLPTRRSVIISCAPHQAVGTPDPPVIAAPATDPSRSRRGTRRGGVPRARAGPLRCGRAGRCRVGQVDGPVLQRVGAHHRRLGQICRGLGPALLREPGGHRGDAAGQELARRLLRARDLEVEVVAASV